MKFTGMSHLFIYTTAMFLCKELCYCFWIERGLQDEFELLNNSTCDAVDDSNRVSDKCECATGEPILASNNNTNILCSKTEGTNTYLP